MKKLFAACLVLLLLAGCAQGGDASSASPPGPTPTPKRQTLTVCVEFNDNLDLDGLFERFEYRFPEIELVVEELPTFDSPEREAVLKQLRTEIMAGGGPDAFFLGSYSRWQQEAFADLPKAMRQGAFLDLNPLLEQKGYSAEDYLAPVVQAGQVDGKQYLFPLGYIPNGVGVTTSAAAEVRGAATPLELMQRLMTLDGTCQGATATPFLYALTPPVLDYDTEATKFDSVPVKELCQSYLEWAQRDRGEEFVPNSAFYTEKFIEEYWRVVGYEPFYHMARMAKLESDSAFIGIPGEDGGYSATVSRAFGVRANSEADDAAVDLLLLALEEDFQTGHWCEVAPNHFSRIYAPGSIDALPVRKGCLTEALARDEFSSFKDTGNVKFVTAPLLPGAVANLQEFEAYLTRVDWGWPADCFTEWNHTLSACLRGETNLEETLADFQTRWQCYLSE